MTQNLQEVDLSNYARMYLFKGMFGTGKSPAAASFPGVYFMDFDRRAAALRKMFPHKKDIWFDSFLTYKDYAEKFESLLKSCPYETIVIDSATNFVELVMSYFISLRGGNTTTSATKTEGEKETKGKRTKGDVVLLSIDDYSAETRAVSEMLINLKYLAEKGTNVILTAHVITTQTTNIKTKAVSTEKFLLTYGKKAAGKIPTLFDEIYHFYTEAPVIVGEPAAYLINTENDGDDFARTSFHLPNQLDWTDKNLYELIKPYFTLTKESPMDTSMKANLVKEFDGLSVAPTSLNTESESIITPEV